MSPRTKAQAAELTRRQLANERAHQLARDDPGEGSSGKNALLRKLVARHDFPRCHGRCVPSSRHQVPTFPDWQGRFGCSPVSTLEVTPEVRWYCRDFTLLYKPAEGVCQMCTERPGVLKRHSNCARVSLSSGNVHKY